MKPLPLIAALLLAPHLCAQTDPADLLREARTKILTETEALARYTCVETVQRTRFEPLRNASPKRCDLLGRTIEAWSDRLRLDVTVSDGSEIFSWAGARRFDLADARAFAGGGLTAAGDFGRFLVSIFGAGAEVRFTAWEQSLAVYRYRVPVAASRYEIALEARSLPMAYEGRFWLDARSTELKRLTIEVPNPPRAAETCRIETRIDYQRAQIGGMSGGMPGGASISLPQLTQLKLWDAEGGRWENRTTYSGCRAFGSESRFRTDMAGAVTEAAAHPAPAAVPPGLTLQIALRSAVSEAASYAGDAVEGQLLHPLRTPEGRVLVPEGTRIQGRIVRAERHLQPTRYFTLGLTFETITLDGAEAPLSLEFVPRSREERALNGSSEKRTGTGLLLFREDPAELEPGFVTEWKSKR